MTNIYTTPCANCKQIATVNTYGLCIYCPHIPHVERKGSHKTLAILFALMVVVAVVGVWAAR